MEKKKEKKENEIMRKFSGAQLSKGECLVRER